MKLKQITVRVAEEIANLFQKTFDTSKLESKAVLIKRLLDFYNDPEKTIIAETEKNRQLSQTIKNLKDGNIELSNSITTFQDEILKLQDEISGLKLKTDGKNMTNVDLSNENTKLLAQIATLQNQVTELENTPQVEIKDKTLAANQIIMTIPEGIKYFLNIVTKAESERVKKVITSEIMLLQLFWKQITSGPGDHLPCVWNKSQIRNILIEIKEKEEKKAHEQTSD